MFVSRVQQRCSSAIIMRSTTAMSLPSSLTIIRTSRCCIGSSMMTNSSNLEKSSIIMITSQIRQMHLWRLSSVYQKSSTITPPMKLMSFGRRMESSSTTTTTTTTTNTVPSPPPATTTATTATTTTVAQESAATATTTASKQQQQQQNKGWWYSAELWGTAGALACWGMAGSAIYDAFSQGPEVISVSMTPILIIYSAMFTRWAWIVQPRNTFLAACHVTNIVAQGNQLRRALEYKYENGQEAEVNAMIQQAGIGGILITTAIAIGPMVRTMLSKVEMFGTTIASIAAADAGPFTVHFWAPMSKWAISGASFFDLHRPTEKISLAQYSALTLTGFFFSRYALLVSPINYALCSVNVAMFASSGWHLGRKINADYLHIGLDPKK